MNTCDGCKFWGREFNQVCDFVDTIQATQDVQTKIEIDANAADDSGLYARLVTGPKFGCIKFAQ